MAYSVESKKSGKTYYLHGRAGKGGRTLYFFAGDIRDDALDDLPAGYIVIENARTGLPMLKKG